MNKRIIALLSVTIFTVWILPLGAFIKPNSEEKACNGRRAICLCKNLLARQLAKNGKKTFLVKYTATQTHQTGAFSNAPDFIAANPAQFQKTKKDEFRFFETYPIQKFIIRSIEHVPKA